MATTAECLLLLATIKNAARLIRGHSSCLRSYNDLSAAQTPRPMGRSAPYLSGLRLITEFTLSLLPTSPLDIKIAVVKSKNARIIRLNESATGRRIAVIFEEAKPNSLRPQIFKRLQCRGHRQASKTSGIDWSEQIGRNIRSESSFLVHLLDQIWARKQSTMASH